MVDRSRSVPALVLAAMLASAMGIGIIQGVHPFFALPGDLGDYPLSPSPEYLAKYNAAQRDFYSRNYALDFAILASILGLTLGATASRKSRVKVGVASGLVGALFAGLAGLGVGYLVAGVLDSGGEAITVSGVTIEPIVQTTVLQIGVWTLIGCGVLIGFAIGSNQATELARAIKLGGAVGGVTGLVYTLVSSLAFTNSNSFLILPRTLVERLAWGCCGGLVMAVFIASAVSRKHQHAESKHEIAAS